VDLGPLRVQSARLVGQDGELSVDLPEALRERTDEDEGAPGTGR
jgi:hypothetical protein